VVTAFLLALAAAGGVLVARSAVLAALRRAVAWEDACRSRLRDRQWAEAEARWSGRSA
jgi:hypothetical protein